MDINEFLNEWQNDSDTVWVHTSGSTGKPKPMQVEKRRMEASARITCDFLGLKEGDTALLCMSLDYIAGKMMVVRALTCGLRLISVEPKGYPQWEGAIDFAAMVPMQVWNLVQQAPERLRQIRHLIIGGGAISNELADATLKELEEAISDALQEAGKGKGYVIDCAVDQSELVRPMVNGGTHITEFLLN